jgi:hypothetical protein
MITPTSDPLARLRSMLEQLRSGIMSAEWVANVADVDQLRGALTAAEARITELTADRDAALIEVRECDRFAAIFGPPGSPPPLIGSAHVRWAFQQLTEQQENAERIHRLAIDLSDQCIAELTAERDALRAAAIKAVEDEPELPDAMPEGFMEAVSEVGVTEVLRITVRLTKENIVNRLRTETFHAEHQYGAGQAGREGGDG